MKIFFLYPSGLWILLALPLLRFFHRRHVKEPSIVIPNVTLLEKIIGQQKKQRVNFPLCYRYASILLLIIAYAEPMAMTELQIIRCNRYLIATSLCVFLLEIFLKNTFFHKIP